MNRYETDIKLAAELGSNSFRFTFEWARIEPQRGIIDEAAIQRCVGSSADRLLGGSCPEHAASQSQAPWRLIRQDTLIRQDRQQYKFPGPNGCILKNQAAEIRCLHLRYKFVKARLLLLLFT